MKFLADMGVSRSTVDWLRNQGYDAKHVAEILMHRASDAEILKRAKDELRCVITCDLDFGALMSVSLETRPSVIILRLEDETPYNVNKRLAQVFDESAEAINNGSIVIVEGARHRVRLLPL